MHNTRRPLFGLTAQRFRNEWSKSSDPGCCIWVRVLEREFYYPSRYVFEFFQQAVIFVARFTIVTWADMRKIFGVGSRTWFRYIYIAEITRISDINWQLANFSARGDR